MGRIVNELDTINFSIKKASQLVKEIGRQVKNKKQNEKKKHDFGFLTGTNLPPLWKGCYG